jgi:hypothetical protein
MSEVTDQSSTRGYLELRLALAPPKPEFTSRVLLDAAEGAAIHTFGWPIGVVIHRDEYAPRPTTDGIVAEVSVPRQSYDFWSLRTNGDYYLLQSLFEDQRTTASLFADTRVVRVTESLLFCARLYSRLGVNRSSVVHVGIRHGGLKGRHLRTANPLRFLALDRTTVETRVDFELSATLAELEDDLVSYVKRVCDPLFMVFDFFELSEGVYRDLVDGFVAGQVR